MKPWWTRGDDTVSEAKWKSFELKGVWLRLAESGSDKKRQVLILRQLCHITTWLAIIGVCQILSTCRLITL